MSKTIRIALFTLALLSVWGFVQSATITSTKTWTVNEQVTAQKLNDWPGQMTVSLIQGGDIAGLAINNTRLGPNCVTTDKILDGTILGADIAAATITGSLMATGSVDSVQLATNILFRSGVYAFTNANTVVNMGSSNTTVNLSGANIQFSAGQIPSSAISNATISTVLTTNIAGAVGGNAFTWVTVLSLTTTSTNGTVMVSAKASPSSVSAAHYIRIRDASTNIIAQSMVTDYADSGAALDRYFISASGSDSLSGAAKTYYLDIASANSSCTWTNSAGASTGPLIIDGGPAMKILQTP